MNIESTAEEMRGLLMEELRLGAFALLDMVKCFIIVYGVLGFEIRREKKVFWCVPVIVLGAIGHVYSGSMFTFVDVVTQFLIILFLFNTDLKRKIKVTILQFVLMCTFDMIIWFVVVGLTPLGENYKTNEIIIKVVGNLIAIIIWILVSLLLKSRRKVICTKIKNIKIMEFIFIVIGLFSLSLVVSGIQGQFWNEMTLRIQRGIMILGVFAVVFLFVVLILFIYVSDAKEKLQYINELNEQCIKYQKDYYMETIKFDEEMRAFRHDVNKHYEVLGMLIRERDFDKAEEYIRQLSDRKDSNKVYKTGNDIADYIINGKINTIKKQKNVEINVLGEFPGNTLLEDTDLCIILGNALDNAEEALVKVKENKKLNIYIGSYKQTLFIEIVNSSVYIETKKVGTTKKDKMNHGYGLENIKKVVGKYDGTMTTEYENGCFSLKIEL